MKRSPGPWPAPTENAFAPMFKALEAYSKVAVRECANCKKYKPMTEFNRHRWMDAGVETDSFFCNDDKCQKRKWLLPS